MCSRGHACSLFCSSPSTRDVNIDMDMIAFQLLGERIRLYFQTIRKVLLDSGIWCSYIGWLLQGSESYDDRNKNGN